ncbi:hypothetical protein [Nocardia cyriacigeorgica]|uniref:hypothetical protein n=1 Tax=Nocardia cyriacigeorgica TaxID=135487 RepID=UPI002453EE35|nr:hypothetical protein [Nocardia cyriacigeorgica]
MSAPARTCTDVDLPPFPQLWARWAAMSAAFAAAGSQWGPRMLPSLAWFESSGNSGSTLYALPGGRAVLSGGVWTSDTARSDDDAPPPVHPAPPDWAVDPMLNPHADTGLTAFCYWWDAGHWSRADSPPVAQSASALPGLWTTDSVAELITCLATGRPNDDQRAHAVTLICAAEIGAVTHDTVANVFGDNDLFDLDAAMDQFEMAGLTARQTATRTATQCLRGPATPRFSTGSPQLRRVRIRWPRPGLGDR